jgi:hypothetical protein
MNEYYSETEYLFIYFWYCSPSASPGELLARGQSLEAAYSGIPRIHAEIGLQCSEISRNQTLYEREAIAFEIAEIVGNVTESFTSKAYAKFPECRLLFASPNYLSQYDVHKIILVIASRVSAL